MLKLVKIAVTGGLSCGKSSVCHILKEFGAYVVNADAIVHKVLSPETTLGEEIVQNLGSDIVVDGKFDRRKIAEKVFNSPLLLRSLEDILHPEVEREIERQYKEVQRRGSASLFVAEIPLLFESQEATRNKGFFDYILVVASTEEKCRLRFKEKTGYSDEEYNKRAARQWPIEKKVAAADFVIENNGTEEELKEKVKNLFKIF